MTVTARATATIELSEARATRSRATSIKLPTALLSDAASGLARGATPATTAYVRSHHSAHQSKREMAAARASNTIASIAARAIARSGRRRGGGIEGGGIATIDGDARSEEHTSELQSLAYLVCR